MVKRSAHPNTKQESNNSALSQLIFDAAEDAGPARSRGWHVEDDDMDYSIGSEALHPKGGGMSHRAKQIVLE